MEVHLIERFLHALQMFAARADQALAVAHEAAHRAHCGRRAKRGVQQAHRVQVLQPLAVLHVGLAGRHVFDVAGVDQTDFQPARFENLKQRHPVDAVGLHRHGRDLAGDEPVGQRVQVFGEGAERAHRLRIPSWCTATKCIVAPKSTPAPSGRSVGAPKSRACSFFGHEQLFWTWQERIPTATAQRVKKHEQTPRRGQPGEPGASNDSMHDLRHQAEWRAPRRTNVESVYRLPRSGNHSAQPTAPLALIPTGARSANGRVSVSRRRA
jgi:hypothetical protein